jgi:hypothetical protein
VDINEGVGILALVPKDDVITGIPNSKGLTTSNGNRWARRRLASLRSNDCIQTCRAAEDGVEPLLDLSRAAAIVGARPGC